jgi:hypothetical protein
MPAAGPAHPAGCCRIFGAQIRTRIDQGLHAGKVTETGRVHQRRGTRLEHAGIDIRTQIDEAPDDVFALRTSVVKRHRHDGSHLFEGHEVTGQGLGRDIDTRKQQAAEHLEPESLVHTRMLFSGAYFQRCRRQSRQGQCAKALFDR